MRAAVIVAVFAFSHLNAQNLVRNGGFEDYNPPKNNFITASGSWFEVYGLKNWTQPSHGSSDFYYKNQSGKFNMDQFGGLQQPASGMGLIGFITWVPGREYREYMQGELIQPLVAGQKYKFSVKVCAGPKCPYLVNELGAFFSADKFAQGDDKTLKRTPQIRLDADAMETSPSTWIILENVFTAKGGEKYITFGNFLNDSFTVITKCKGDEVFCPYAYFYADDMVLQVTTEDPTVPYTPTPLASHFVPGQSFIARGINFDLDKATLRPESYIQLHEIAAELKHKPTLKVEIRGYTDSSGNEAHNLSLSKARAKAVADYLISTGIDKNRITYGGYGSADPLPGVDPVLNRRVEFIFK